MRAKVVSHVAGWLGQQAFWQRTSWQWCEAILLSTVGLGIGRLLSPQDVYGIHAGFPWQWLGPLLVALRYGVLPGLLSALVLLAGWPWFGDGAVPAAYFIGGLMLVMIGGEFSGIWNTRIRRVQELNQYLDERMDQLARRYHLLRLSHERLEQNLISRPLTLRDALAQLRTMLIDLPPSQGLSGAQPFIEFLTQFCQLESAQLFEVTDGKTVGEPVARIGPPESDSNRDDPLLRFAMQRRELSHVQTEGIDEGGSALLVAVPLITSLGRIRGILAVKRMPFFALNDDTLQMLSVLCAYYIEQLVVRDTAAPLLDVMPDCPVEFAYELFKLQRVQRETGLSSMIVVQIFHPSRWQRDVFDTVSNTQRGLDQIWRITTAANKLIVTLMPLATEVSVQGYTARIEHLIQEKHGIGPAEARYECRTVDLARPGGWLLLQDVLSASRN
ncbi:PelD GGDEF domain-containing protein [Andreprevotia chitinilytica]|uniref:PelD GGDEF domain-containing protein n=1 Tax=Andreprevotia chitinilytica TaxID=396808 RepID=UPI00068FBEFD|nr:PelD GGDEF domain-containing protein [Andreprevotia chitinilytica]